MSPRISFEASAQEARSIRIRDAVFQRGKENYIDIELNSEGDVNGIVFTLEFDVEQLEYVRAELGTLVPDSDLEINSDFLNEGLLGITMALNHGEVFEQGVRKIMRIYFQVPLLSQSNVTQISFVDTIVTPGVTDVDGNDLPADFLPGAIVFDPQVSPTPSITSLDPSAVIVGGPDLNLIVNGSDFVDGAVVTVDGQRLDTLFISSSELRAVIPARDISETGAVRIGVINPPPGGQEAMALELLVIEPVLVLPGRNPTPALSKISPALAAEGGRQFSLVVNGFGFVNGVTVLINGSPRITTLVSGNALNVLVPATDTARAGTLKVQAVNPGPGGGASNSLSLEVKKKSPIPRILSLDPGLVTAGSPSFSMTVNGVNFVTGAGVRVNGVARSTSFISAGQLRVTMSATDIAAAPGPVISVVNPLPGGGTSNRVRLSVEAGEFPPGASNPRPSISKISPAVLAIGSVPVTLTITGSNFIQSSEVSVNGNRCATRYISATELSAEIPALFLHQAATLQIKVFNGEPGGGTSNTIALQVKPLNPLPHIDSLDPDKVAAGSASLTMLVNGSGFVSGAIVRLNGVNRNTTFINSKQLKATINAADISKAGTALITASNPAPGGGSTSSLPLAILAPEFPPLPNNPLPAITKTDPGIIGVGTVPVIITLTGARYIPGSEVRINGNRITSTYVSSTRLTAIIPASDIAQPGILKLQVFNGEPGGGTSNTISIEVRYPSPLPRLESISPDTVRTGGDDFTLALKGNSFAMDSLVLFNGRPLETQYVSNSQLTASISSSDIISEDTVKISVINPGPGGGNSNAADLSISDTAPPMPADNPEPTLDGIDPYLVAEGGASFILRVTGYDFVNGSDVLIDGRSRPAKFISDTELEVLIQASDIASAGYLSIHVRNPEPGGGVSSELTLEVRKQNPLPRVLSINPTLEYVNASTFNLIVQGRNFVQDAVGQINGEDRPTEFIGNSKLRVTFYLSDVSENGTIVLGVRNPQPGGGNSNRLLLTILNPQ